MFTFLILLGILLVAIVVMLYNKKLYLRFIRGNSMAPTFIAGQPFFVCSKYELQEGKIYVFSAPNGETVIKRLHKIVYGTLYFLGDNEEFSYDSRDYGYVSTKAVIGEAKKIKELFGLWQK